MDHQHLNHSLITLRKKFWVSVLLTIPVTIYSPNIQGWLGFVPPNFMGSDFIPFIFSTIIFFYGGLIFIKGALDEIKTKRPGMMILVSLAIITALLYSIATMLFISGDSFFWELSTLIDIMLLGHWLEMASINKAESSLNAIKQLLPNKAEKLVKGVPTQVLLVDLKVGDLILVRPGSIISVDGIVIEGSSSVNEAIITGESQLVSKSIGNNVIAGTINQEGVLTVKIIKIGEGTFLSEITRLITEAQNSKSNIQLLADKAAFILTIFSIVVAVITFICWSILQNAGFALERSVAVLIIACPHALGLAIPLVVSISTTLAARNGLLIRRRSALESARNINIILFDKTGTLTKGELEVTDIWVDEGYDEKIILNIIASLEQNSEHSIGKSIVKYANQHNISLDKIQDFTNMSGSGVKGTLHQSERYIIASRRYVAENNVTIQDELSKNINQEINKGKTGVYLISDNKVIGIIAMADIVRDEAKSAIAMLKKLGIKTAMITGDNIDVARHITDQIGINEFFAGMSPNDKVNKIKELQKSGLRVAMVGDGVNDAPVLSQADIGIAIGSGTNIAIESADIILTKSNLYDVIKIIKLSKATYTKMWQNLIWATGYNIIAIPLAAGVLFGFGIILNPTIGAILMSISTIIVVLNAQLLRRVKLLIY